MQTAIKDGRFVLSHSLIKFRADVLLRFSLMQFRSRSPVGDALEADPLVVADDCASLYFLPLSLPFGLRGHLLLLSLVNYTFFLICGPVVISVLIIERGGLHYRLPSVLVVVAMFKATVLISAHVLPFGKS